MKSNSHKKIISIVGVGLIGGSMALKLHEKKLSSKLIGVEANLDNAQTAIDLELVDEILSLDDAIKISDIIILAVPVDYAETLLKEILDKIDKQIVFDVGSTKNALCNAVANHPKRGRYVACHPMWGTEYFGPQAAQRDAFENKAVVICEAKKSDEDALQWVLAMYKKIGMHILEMDALNHDLHVAYISHISHITSFALANTVLEKESEDKAIFELASSGFESTVRLAKSNASMWVPIFLQNKKYILDVLSEHIFQLGKYKTAIENGNKNDLENLIAQANKIKQILK